MHNIHTSELEVQRLLSRLNVHKSTGPDAIGNWVLKNCSTSLCKPLTAVFNKSQSDGIFPSVWKQANVCPVFKKGIKSDKTNYRPISLLSNTSKILEKIVYKRLYEFLTDNNLLTEQNSSFKKNDSTINQLLKIVHQIYQDINDGKDAVSIQYVLSPHNALCHKHIATSMQNKIPKKKKKNPLKMTMLHPLLIYFASF